MIMIFYCSGFRSLEISCIFTTSRVTSIGVPGLFNFSAEETFNPDIINGLVPPNDPVYVLGNPTSNF